MINNTCILKNSVTFTQEVYKHLDICKDIRFLRKKENENKVFQK